LFAFGILFGSRTTPAMIRVHRGKVVSEILLSKRAQAARKEAEAFYGRPRGTRTQERHSFQEELWRQTTEDLRRLFRAKCAYFEKRVAKSEPILVDHFRPTGHAKQLVGSSSPDHYWWLAYEYENLYPACVDCHRHKGTMFPVKGQRAAKGEVGKDLRKERALLLDPCSDNPQEYLYFLKDGRVVPASGRGRDQKARAGELYGPQAATRV